MEESAICHDHELTVTISGAPSNARTAIASSQTSPKIARGNLAGTSWTFPVDHCTDGALINGDTGAPGIDIPWRVHVFEKVSAPTTTSRAATTTTTTTPDHPTTVVSLVPPLRVYNTTTTVARQLPNTGASSSLVAGAGLGFVMVGALLLALLREKVR